VSVARKGETRQGDARKGVPFGFSDFGKGKRGGRKGLAPRSVGGDTREGKYSEKPDQLFGRVCHRRPLFGPLVTKRGARFCYG
jgi:hypothetical protein